MKRLIQRLLYKLPKYKRNIWYNYYAHMREENIFPKVFDPEGNYINCKIGLHVHMGNTNDGKEIYYEVCGISHKRGSDWLYDSDSIECDLKFSHLKSVKP